MEIFKQSEDFIIFPNFIIFSSIIKKSSNGKSGDYQELFFNFSKNLNIL
jgi:hypothetical protein